VTDFAPLPPETPGERRAKAQITEADVLALREFAASLKMPGRVLDQAGQVHTTSAEATRAMLLAAKAE
jgi:hypothetical protein